MTTKIAAAVLLVAAFGYALWLHILRRPLPNATSRRGWRRGFFWATALFVAWMGANTCHAGEASGKSTTTATTTPLPKPGLSEAVRAAWLSLDRERGEELRLALEKEVEAKDLSADAAKQLQIAFRHTGYHYWRNRSSAAVRFAIACYGLVSYESYIAEVAREHLLTRMDLLAEAGRKGRIDKGTYEKVVVEIAQSLAVLDAADAKKLLDYKNDPDPSSKVREKRQEIADALREGTAPIPVDAATTEAAALLADMAANAPEGWAKPPPEYRKYFLRFRDEDGEQVETDSDLTKPGVWQPPRHRPVTD